MLLLHALPAGIYSFVPSLSAKEFEQLEVKRVPQNAGQTVEMQVRSCVTYTHMTA